MRKVLLSVLCLFAAVAVNAAKEVDIPLDEGWADGWSSTTTYADGVLTIAIASDWGAGQNVWSEGVDWSAYESLSVVIDSYDGVYGQIILKDGATDIKVQGHNSLTSSTLVIPLDPTQVTHVTNLIFQGLGGTTYKVSRIFLTEAVAYEETPAATLALNGEKVQFFPSGLFAGFSEDAKVVFTVEIAGSADYNGWGIGELVTPHLTKNASWQVVEGIMVLTVSGGVDGEKKYSFKIKELIPALTSWPDDDTGEYGLVSNMYGQGGGTCTATLKSVEIYEAVNAEASNFVVDVEDGEDIGTAIFMATAGKKIGKLTINLPEQGTAKLSNTLKAADNIIINGNYATVNIADEMKDPFITLDRTTEFAKKDDGTDSDHKLIGKVEFNDVTIVGLQNALVKDNQKTLLEELIINNSNIEMPAAGKNVIDFNGKGYVGKVSVDASTIWAADKNTGFFAQYGSRPKNVNEKLLQEFSFETSTIVNIANGKNFCDLKQNGTAQNVYTVKDCIFVDCGKSAGQTIVGMNKGQTSATPVWDVSGNYFAWGGECTNAAEIEKAGQKDGEDIVKDCIDGKLTFDDAANGDFNGTFELGADVEEPDFLGDDDWSIEFTVTETGISTVKADTNNDVIYNLNGQQVVKAQKGLYIINGKKAIVK